ncbi:MAG: DNA-binding transcriptional LysR family regulator [Paraglaciecola psychrophila]|jgi:DNA-binding transcriptional LysR family regulator
MPLYPDISFEQMKAFRAVAERGSFSAAAKTLFRTQSAISIQVARLEKNIDQRLFHRSTKSVELTPAGDILLDYVNRIFDTVQEARAAMGDLDNVVQGRLVIATSDTTACYRLPQLLQEFQQHYPLVELLIQNHTSPQTIEKVLSRDVDIGIATIRDVPSQLICKPLYQRQDILICHPQHMLAKCGDIALKKMEKYPALLLDQQCSSRRLLDDYCVKAKVRLNIAMELSSIEVIKTLVKIDTGISIVPEISVRTDIEQGLLAGVAIADITQQPGVQIGTVYHSRRYLSKAAQAFMLLLENTQ